MKLDPARHYFAVFRDGAPFFPLPRLLVLGSVWAFKVPSLESAKALVRIARIYEYGSILSLAVAIPIGIATHLVWPCYVTALVVSLLAFFAIASRNAGELPRIPVSESIAIFAAKVGEVRLWQNVLLGAFFLIITVWFFPPGWLGWTLFAMNIAMFINSALAIAALFYFKSPPDEPEAPTGTDRAA